MRALVVGVGHLGKEHARIYTELPGVELVGVVDRDPERAREIADRLTATGKRKIWHGTSGAQAPADIDLVSVVVPTPLHLEVARPFLEAGKAVLVEKPLASTLAEADELLAIAERSGSVLQVGHIERFNPVVVAALPYLKNPLFIECDRIHPFSLRATDVSVVLDLMIHDIDLILHFIGGELENIDAFGASVLSPTEDLATARLVFKSGCCALVKTSRVALNRSRKIRVFGERSYLSLDLVQRTGFRIFLAEGYDPQQFLDQMGRISAPEGEAAFLAKVLRQESLVIETYEPLKAEIESFVSAARERRTPVVTGREGRRAMAAAAEITRSIGEHRRRVASMLAKK
ncbi:MAG: Gfo/Idh/MocA family oxidoreductase [Planctomycetota bacterium]